MSLETPRERVQREKERQEFIDSLEIREDYRRTFESPHGRRVLKDFILGSHVFETTCTGNAWSHFYEGERNWFHRIAAKIPGIAGEIMAEVMAERQAEMEKAMSELRQEQA